MLQNIRDNTQGLVAKIFVWFLIGIFALWGLDSIVGNFFVTAPTLTVNGITINEADIEALTQSKAQEFYGNLTEDSDLSNLDESQFRQSAVAELIQREILGQSANNAGMGVSSAAIDKRIAMTPDFQVDGVFNAERATLLLQNVGFTPSSYRATLAKESMMNQMLSAYSASGFATSKELAQLASLTHQKRSARYAVLGLIGQAGIVISENEISSYYNENQDDFVTEEQVTIEYLELDKQKILDAISVSEEQIQAAYAEEITTFQSQTERRASHILFEASTEEEFSAALIESTNVKARLVAGEDFAKLAAEFSDDTGSSQNGGDVGYTSGDNFVAEFETTLQSLALQQVSEPIRTEFGVHLIKLTEQAETALPTYDDRSAVIANNLKASQADSIFIAKADELSNLVFESPDLTAPATSMGIELLRSELFGRSGGTGISAEAGVINAAFSAEVLEDRLNSELIQVNASRSVVIRVVDHRLPLVQELAVVSSEIEVMLQLKKMKEQVRASGESLVNSLKAGDNIDGLLQAQNTTWSQLDAVERSSPNINPEISNYVFSMPRPLAGTTDISGLQLADGSYLVIELQSVVDGSAADFNTGEAQNMRNFLSQQASANDFSGFMESLESNASIQGRDDPLLEEPLL